MRFVIIGAGAIGGVVGAGLYEAGRDVLLVARGAHHDAIAARGLTLETPRRRVTLPIPVTPTPTAKVGDIVLLATKSQDTQLALCALRDVAPASTPIVCLQNGIENERVALRRFAHVYGAVVMAPTAHLEPGVVQAYGAALAGAIDIGRYPSGVDERCRKICDALASGPFRSQPQKDIMRLKRAKLIGNLANAVEVVCGSGESAGRLVERARSEARAVFLAAGLEFEQDEVADVHERWQRWEIGEIRGRARGGGSTWQSVVRGRTSLETDYLNGEIALLGRLIGVPTPVNELLQELAFETVHERHEPGWLSPEEALDRL
jgi:2-dehydropantoate 2-reductase